MKAKIFSLMALVLCLVSCQTEPEGLDVIVGGEVDTVVTVTIPEAETRADSSSLGVFNNDILDDENVTMRYILEIYYGDESRERLVQFNDGTEVAFQVRLVPDRHYNFVVWADVVTKEATATEFTDADNHYNTRNLKAITLKDWDAMDETRDAFTGYFNTATDGNKTPYNGSKAINIPLIRPFAKLRVITTDFDELAKYGIEAKSGKVTYLSDNCGRASFNAYNGEPSDAVTSFLGGAYDIVTYASETGGDEHTIFSDYIFASTNGDIVKFDLNIYEEGNNLIKANHFNTDIPVKRNYITTLKGNVLTDGNNIKVEVEDEFENGSEWNPGDDMHDVEVWDGKSTKEPAKDSEGNYIIKLPSELAWLAAAVNGTLNEEYTRATVAANDFSGKTFILSQDIDLGNEPWTPIGSNGKIFKGTFDGNNKKIANLVVNGYNNNAGLFGVTHDGEIKNFTVENAKVSGRLYVGVVAGTPYTSKYTNITIKGHVEVNGMAYVGGVGGKDAYADWTNITVAVDETSYVKANSVENGTAYRTYVGGVVGFNGEGGHKFSNIASNINVKGSTCDVGGLFGIAHYGNKFVNCECTGTVTNTTDEVENAYEMGGIAGVWHNADGTSVTLTDCKFEGELSTPNITENVNFYYNGLIGAPYSTTGKGELLIQGKVYVSSAAELQNVVANAEGEITIGFGNDIEGDVTIVQKAGVEITIDGEGKKFIGSIKVHSNSNHYADAALTIKNLNFETSTASVNFIEALENGAERYSTNITVEECTFTATGEAVNTAVGVQIKSSKNAKVIGCTATNMHSLIQAQSCDETVVVKNCEVNGKNGVAFKQVKAATVEGTTIVATGYGIRFDGNIDNYGITVKDNNVTAAQPFIVRKMTGKNNTITLEGENTLTTEAAYQIVITNGQDDAEYVKPTGTYTLTGADNYTIFPEPFPVASWDEFTAALAAGETDIKLTADITYDNSYDLKKDVTINLNGKSLEISNPSLMLNIHSNVTIKNGTIKGKVYARKNADITFNSVNFGGTINAGGSTEGLLQVQGACNVYAMNCKFNATNSDSQKSRPLSIEGRSSGTLKFENCEFKSNANQNQVYVNSLSGTATLDFTNCNFNNKTPNIMFAAACPLTNLTMSGTTKLSSVTLEINRAKDVVTESDFAYLREMIANNSFSSVRVFYAGGSSEYIR